MNAVSRLPRYILCKEWYSVSPVICLQCLSSEESITLQWFKKSSKNTVYLLSYFLPIQPKDISTNKVLKMPAKHFTSLLSFSPQWPELLFFSFIKCISILFFCKISVWGNILLWCQCCSNFSILKNGPCFSSAIKISFFIA